MGRFRRRQKTTDNKIKKQENVQQDVVPPPSLYGKKVVEITENNPPLKVDTTISAVNDVIKPEITDTINENKAIIVEKSENIENITENKDKLSQQDIVSIEKTEPKQLQNPVVIQTSPIILTTAETNPAPIKVETNPAPTKVDPTPTTTQKGNTTDESWSEWE